MFLAWLHEQGERTVNHWVGGIWKWLIFLVLVLYPSLLNFILQYSVLFFLLKLPNKKIFKKYFWNEYNEVVLYNEGEEDQHQLELWSAIQQSCMCLKPVDYTTTYIAGGQLTNILLPIGLFHIEMVPKHFWLGHWLQLPIQATIVDFRGFFAKSLLLPWHLCLY